MRRTIVHAMNGTPAEEKVYERLKDAKTIELFGGVFVTAEEIVWGKLMKRYFVSYTDIVWIYKQVEDSHVTLGCCGGVLQEFRVIMKGKDQSLCRITFDREIVADELMRLIAERNPGTAVGYTQENRARFQ